MFRPDLARVPVNSSGGDMRSGAARTLYRTAWIVVGAVVAVAVQAHSPSRAGLHWWLDSSQGVYVTVRALGITAVLAGLTVPPPLWQLKHWVDVACVWIGANLGLS